MRACVRVAAVTSAIVLGACSGGTSDTGGGGGVASCTADCGAHAIVEGGQVNAHAIAVSQGQVFWSTEPQGGKPNFLRRVASSGGQVSDVANDPGRFQLGANAGSVFFLLAGGLVRLDTATAKQTVLVAKLSGPSVNSIAADATHVYWADGDDIERVPIDGGAPETVYSTPEVARIVVDAGNVYFAEDIDNTLQVVPIDAPSPKTPRTLASQKDTMHFAVWNGTAYFASQRDKTISSVPEAGGTPAKLADTDDEPLSIAADATGVYFGTNKGVSRVPLGGGAASAVSAVDTNSHMVLDIAFDDAHVYWIDYQMQALFRAGK